MRAFARWLKRAALALVLLAVVLAAPVAYVELACQGEGPGQPYAPLLPTEDHRLEARSFMTYPEWHIVHAYDDYAETIRTGDPHDFAYLRSIAGYWSSLCAVTRTAARHGGVDRATKQLVYVIGVSFTLELALKATYEETLGRVTTWLRGAKRDAADRLSAEQAAAYAKFLQQTPWYKWDFGSDAAALADADAETLRDRERALVLGLEYAAKAAYAQMIAAAVADVGADQLTLRMIVSAADEADLGRYDGVTVVGYEGQGLILETPRYRALTRIIRAMADDGLKFVEIAGNDDILFTALSDDATYAGALHSFERQGYEDTRHLIAVRVPQLAEILRGLEGQGLRLEHVHDY